MVDALNRLTELRSFGVSHLEIARLPSGRVKALARYAAAAWAASIARMPPERRAATLVAFAHVFETVAQDDAVDLLNQLITKCLARAEQTGEQVRLRTIHDLDPAAVRLNIVCKVVLDPRCEDGKLRSLIFERVTREQLERDSNAVDGRINVFPVFRVEIRSSPRTRSRLFHCKVAISPSRWPV